MKRDALRMRQRAAGETEVTQVPTEVRLDVPQPGQTNFNQRVRETLMTYLGKQGNFMDRGITVRDLIDSGILALPDGWHPGLGGPPPFMPGTGEPQGGYKVDLSPPPDVTGFVVSPGISVVFVETDDPAFTQGHGYLRTNIYGAIKEPEDPIPTFADAQFLFSFAGEIGSWATQPATTFHLWAKWETKDGEESVNPVGGTNGQEVTTGQDMDKMILALTGPGHPFKVVTDPIQLPDGSTVPPGFYINDAYIHRMQVTEAMVHDASITNAKIVDLSADKLKAGTISVGQYIRSSGYVAGNSGWIINGNGSAEFSNVTVRGTVYATAGSFSGTINARGGIGGGGNPGNYNWPPAGQTGYFLGPGGLLVGNGNDGSKGYFQIEESTGNVYSPGLNIVNRVATFTGSINVSSSGGADRMELRNNVIKIFQAWGLRVQIGDLNA